MTSKVTFQKLSVGGAWGWYLWLTIDDKAKVCLTCNVGFKSYREALKDFKRFKRATQKVELCDPSID